MTTTELHPDTLRLLAAGAGDRAVVSLYLDVDGRRWPRYQDCELRVDRLVKRVVESMNGHVGEAGGDLRRIESYVKSGVDRSSTRGIAVFSGGPDFWHTFELPVPVRDQLVVNKTPHLHQLESVVATHEPFAVLLVDRQRARMFVFDLGRLVDKSERFDALPRHDDDAGARDRRHDRHKLETAAHHHVKNAAQTAFDVYHAHPFSHLVIAAADDIANELEGDLHPYLRERIAARVKLAITAPEAEIRAAADAVGEEVERRKEAELVGRLRDSAAAGRGAVVGLAPSLQAVGERRVDTLVVSEGFDDPGWACSCGQLATKGPKCASCGAAMERSDDIVERAIEEALLQSATVKVCVGNADLDVAGRIGALLRF